MRRLALLTLCLVPALTVATLTVATTVASAQTKAATGKGAPKMSKGERDAVQALLQSQAPDDRIKAADDLITKFADTPFKSFALFQEADAWEQKGDHTEIDRVCRAGARRRSEELRRGNSDGQRNRRSDERHRSR